MCTQRLEDSPDCWCIVARRAVLFDDGQAGLGSERARVPLSHIRQRSDDAQIALPTHAHGKKGKRRVVMRGALHNRRLHTDVWFTST